MDAKTRKCTVCQTEYEYCPRCSKYADLPHWMFSLCSENCKNIYHTTANYENKLLSAKDAKKALITLDLTKKANFGQSYQESISEIMATSEQESKKSSDNINLNIDRQNDIDNKSEADAKKTQIDKSFVKKKSIVTKANKEAESNVE